MDWPQKRTFVKEIMAQLYVYSLHIAGFYKCRRRFFIALGGKMCYSIDMGKL